MLSPVHFCTHKVEKHTPGHLTPRCPFSWEPLASPQGWKLLQSRENQALFDNIQDEFSSYFHMVDAAAEFEDSNHISKFHQLKHDPAVSRRRLAPHLQHNYPGNYVNSGVFYGACLSVTNFAMLMWRKRFHHLRYMA